MKSVLLLLVFSLCVISTAYAKSESLNDKIKTLLNGGMSVTQTYKKLAPVYGTNNLILSMSLIAKNKDQLHDIILIAQKDSSGLTSIIEQMPSVDDKIVALDKPTSENDFDPNMLMATAAGSSSGGGDTVSP
ncbi:MAG: hypothetical protein R8M45_04405 [Ghiorsea sp.]